MKYSGILCMLLVLFSCEHPLEPTRPTVTSVIISPSEAELSAGDTLQFNAAIEGTGEFDSTVTWQVNYGSITTKGLYIAPEVVSADSLALVQALSVADPSKLDSAFVTIRGDTTGNDTIVVPTITSVTVAPPEVTLTVGENAQFEATVEGLGEFDSTVMWCVNGAIGGNETYGTITQGGSYTTPSSVPIELQAVVKAISVADSTKCDSVIVEIFAIDSVSISPQPDSVFVGYQEQFIVTVHGVGNVVTDVIWLVNDTVGGTERYGYIEANGHYTAPPTVPLQLLPTGEAEPEEIKAQAESVADTSKYGSASFFITSGILRLGIDPVLPRVAPGDTIQFTVLFWGSPVDSSVKWYVGDALGGSFYEGGNDEYGTISETGLYIAPSVLPQETDVWVIVQSVADFSKNANADIVNF